MSLTLFFSFPLDSSDERSGGESSAIINLLYQLAMIVDSFKCYKGSKEKILFWPAVKFVAIFASAFSAQAYSGKWERRICVIERKRKRHEPKKVNRMTFRSKIVR